MVSKSKRLLFGNLTATRQQCGNRFPLFRNQFWIYLLSYWLDRYGYRNAGYIMDEMLF
jgi:hypothetical protein